LKKLLATAMALVMTASTLASFPVTAFAHECNTCGVSNNTIQEEEVNPYVTGGRIRNTETVALNWDANFTSVDGIEFDPDRPWTEDEYGTIWQDGIPFANMDNVFIFDTPAFQSHRLLNEGRDPVGYQSEQQLDRVDQMIRDYVNRRQIPLEQILANSQVEAPFMIINDELVNVPTDGLVLLDFDMEWVHPQARVAPEWMQPAYLMHDSTLETRGSRLIPGLVVPEYTENHPGGWVFVHEMFLPMDITQLTLNLRPDFTGIDYIPDFDEFLDTWDSIANPFARVAFVEEFPHLEDYFGNIYEHVYYFYDKREGEFVPYSELQVAGVLAEDFISRPTPRLGTATTSLPLSVVPGTDSPEYAWTMRFRQNGNYLQTSMGNTSISLVFTQFRVTYGNGVYLRAFCAHPWRQTPPTTTVNVTGVPPVIGMLGLYPWNLSTPNTAGRSVQGYTYSRVGAAAAAASSTGVTYHVIPGRTPIQSQVDLYWTATGNLVTGHPDRHSELTTFTLDGTESRPGTNITVEGEKGVPISIPVSFPDPSRVYFAWTVVLAEGQPQVNIESNINFAEVNTGGVSDFTFTIPEDFDEDEVILIFRPWHQESLASGLRGEGGTAQDVWTALPWFWWEITILLEPVCDPVTVTSEEAISLAPLFGLSVNIDQDVLDCITDIEPMVGTYEEYGDSFEGNCFDEEEWEFHVQGYLVPMMIALLEGLDAEEKEEEEEEEYENGECTPSEVDLCGDFSCYEFERDDNTDEQDEGSTGLQDEEEFDLRWNNIAFAFAETHMATEGFNNNGPSSPAGSINLTRTSEVFQAMAGNI